MAEERIVTMSITVKIITKKDIKEIEAGLFKGIYYGLDVKNVAEPKKVEIVKIEEAGIPG